MAATFLRFIAAGGEEIFVRPEAVMAFGVDMGFPKTSWITLWGSDYHRQVRETCQEIATLLTSPPKGP